MNAAGPSTREAGPPAPNPLFDQMESRYRGLLEAAPDAMVVVNQDGAIVILNVRAEKQFGYSRDELIGKQVTTIIPQGFAERLIADGTRTAADALAQQIGMGIELVGRRRNGSDFPIEIMLSPLRGDGGLLVTAAIRDISVRKDAERLLAQSEERYRMLLDGVHDHAIFMLDPQGRVESWNAGAQRIKGYSAEQILGRNFSCFFPPEAIKLGRPEEVLRNAAASGRYEEQGIRVRRDGSRFPAHVTITALRDPAGGLRGFSEFSQDLSQSKESEARYRGLLEAAPDAMVVVNQEGTIVLLNVRAEKQFGYRRDELIGQKVKAIIPAGFAERLIADALRPAEEALAQQIGTGLELTGMRRSGGEFPIEIMLSPLESADGLLVTAAIRDITTRKNAEAQLLRQVEELNRSNADMAEMVKRAATANTELEAFAYSVSHDLRAPLRSLDGFSQVLLEDYADKLDADGKDSLQRIRAASQRMGLLIDDMLSLSQVTRREVVRASVDLSGMAVEIVAELRLRQPQRQVEFIHAPGLIATSDAHLMHIVLANLLGNAWKFTGGQPRARIEFGITGQEGKPVYFVRDNGVGFDMAYAAKLFGAFQRMHSIKDFEGTGIGLATVQRVIHRLGGEVWAEAAIDAGATFYFSLDAAHQREGNGNGR